MASVQGIPRKTNKSFEIIKSPRITEKSAGSSTNANLVVFEVSGTANKSEIKDAVESIFEVKVKAVRTLNVLGKIKRRGRKMKSFKAGDWKKAYVTLMEGHTIDLVEGI